MSIQDKIDLTKDEVEAISNDNDDGECPSVLYDDVDDGFIDGDDD
jgi:hypothetical protein